jgi:hypothetical protein
MHIAEDWFRRAALGDLLGACRSKVNDDRLYRALLNADHKKMFIPAGHCQRRHGRLAREKTSLMIVIFMVALFVSPYS